MPHPFSLKELPRTLVLTVTILPIMLFCCVATTLLSPIKLAISIVDRRPNPLLDTALFVFDPIQHGFLSYFAEAGPQ